MDFDKPVTMNDLIGTAMILIGGYLMVVSFKPLIEDYLENRRMRKRFK